MFGLTNKRTLDKPVYCNGNNEMVNIFNQNYLICSRNPSVKAFRQYGHQCICESCHQKEDDIDIAKSVNCRI